MILFGKICILNLSLALVLCPKLQFHSLFSIFDELIGKKHVHTLISRLCKTHVFANLLCFLFCIYSSIWIDFYLLNFFSYIDIFGIFLLFFGISDAFSCRTRCMFIWDWIFNSNCWSILSNKLPVSFDYSGLTYVFCFWCRSLILRHWIFFWAVCHHVYFASYFRQF